MKLIQKNQIHNISRERIALGIMLVIGAVFVCLLALGIKCVAERNQRQPDVCNTNKTYFVLVTNIVPESIVFKKDVDVIIRKLGAMGEICKIYGHRFTNCDFDNRRCYICGTVEKE